MAVRLSALHAGRPLPPRKVPGTHFSLRLSRPQDHSAAGRIIIIIIIIMVSILVFITDSPSHHHNHFRQYFVFSIITFILRFLNKPSYFNRFSFSFQFIIDLTHSPFFYIYILLRLTNNYLTNELTI
jgi:hypothetical protein